MRDLTIDIVHSKLCGWGFAIYERIWRDIDRSSEFKVVAGESGFKWTEQEAAQRAARYIEKNASAFAEAQQKRTEGGGEEKGKAPA